ncbi:type II secretion system F family protein [Methylocucumis oryzae]|uniref:type II secretion system F family protein n=1 Tax=Methylocucumis oryzae TaxID=1632867 RepID=UPI00069676EF|nr:type II secretion system F family protein [Methylocucumis oryzae]
MFQTRCAGGYIKTLGRTSTTSEVFSNQLDRLLDAAKPYITPQNTKELTKAQERLLHAGFRSPNSLKNYYAIKTLLLLGLPAVLLAILPWLPNLSAEQVAYSALFASSLGIVLPSYYLDKKIAERQQLLIHAFPDALDLLVVCTEAGLGLGAALQRVAQELIAIHPVLALELNLVNAETRAGVDRVQALYGLAKRTGLQEVRSLVGLLAQSITLGTSIAEALRIYSEDFRDKRMQHAEEKAAKLATKMIFPMVFCFFPGFFCIALGPAVIKLMLIFNR